MRTSVAEPVKLLLLPVPVPGLSGVAGLLGVAGLSGIVGSAADDTAQAANEKTIITTTKPIITLLVLMINTTFLSMCTINMSSILLELYVLTDSVSRQAPQCLHSLNLCGLKPGDEHLFNACVGKLNVTESCNNDKISENCHNWVTYYEIKKKKI